MNVEEEAQQLDEKSGALLKDLYENLSPWQKCQVARHPSRPQLPRRRPQRPPVASRTPKGKARAASA